MPQKSIRLRLLLWFGSFLALLITGFGIAVYQLHMRTWLAEVDARLARQVDLVSQAFRSGDKPNRPPPPMFEPDFPGAERMHDPHKRFGAPPPPFRREPVELPVEVTREFGPAEHFGVWGAREQQLLARSSPAVSNVPPPAAAGTQTLLSHRTRGTIREAYQFTERHDCVLVGRDLAVELAQLRQFAGKIAGVGLLVLFLGLAGEFLVSSLLLDSIRRISGTAQRISDGALSERIPADDMDRELGQMARVLNSTFARLEAAFARQQQFTADAAHEFRTPLAVILSETQTALRRDRTPEEYRDTIRACEDAAQKMRRLADSLLELARLDAGGGQDDRASIDLAKVAQECIGLFRPVAEQRGVRIRADLQPVQFTCQPDQLGRVFANLIVNALDHTPAGGTITVSTAMGKAGLVVAIADTGHGIPADDLPHVFERFYRVSRTRSGNDGHAGIGLAICKAIVEAHGGQIEATSPPGAGTTIAMRFPSAAAAG